MAVDRRGLVRRGVAALAVAGLPGFSAAARGRDGTREVGDPGRSAATGADRPGSSHVPEYADWIPAPAAGPGEEALRATYTVDVAELVTPGEELERDVTDPMLVNPIAVAVLTSFTWRSLGEMGLEEAVLGEARDEDPDPENVPTDRNAFVGDYQLYLGSYEESEIRSAIEGGDYAETDREGIYRHRPRETAVTWSDESVVVGPDTAGVEAIADAGSGEVDRWYEVDEDYRWLLETAGIGDYTVIAHGGEDALEFDEQQQPGSDLSMFDGSRGFSQSVTADETGRPTTARAAVAYESEDDVDLDRLESELGAGASDRSVERDGRTVVVDASYDFPSDDDSTGGTGTPAPTTAPEPTPTPTADATPDIAVPTEIETPAAGTQSPGRAASTRSSTTAGGGDGSEPTTTASEPTGDAASPPGSGGDGGGRTTASAYLPWVLGAGGAGVAGLLLYHRRAGADGDPGDAGRRTVEELRTAAVEHATSGDEARERGDYEAAIDSYESAISAYETANRRVDGTDGEGEAGSAETIAAALAATREKRDDLRDRMATVEAVTESLRSAESDFQTAVAEHARGEITAARRDYRQARDHYDRAIEALADADHDPLDDGVTVSVAIDGRPLPEDLADWPALASDQRAALSDAGIETLADLRENAGAVAELVERGEIDEATGERLTAASRFHGESERTFTDEAAIERRRDRAGERYRRL